MEEPEKSLYIKVIEIARRYPRGFSSSDIIDNTGKRKKLERIMSLFLKHSSITNDQVEKLLRVSDATATRYLDQLEKEGRIKKENAGKYLSYSRM